MTQKQLPDRAATVIIGGGSIGCNVAHELAKRGHTDVVLLEMNQLTAGTTWHAAGLVASADIVDEDTIKNYIYSRDVIRTLEDETGLATGFKQVGYMRIIGTEEQLHETRRIQAIQALHGLKCEIISIEEAKNLFPDADFAGAIAACFWPEDGRVNPVDVTMSVAKGARNRGVQIFEGIEAAELIMEDQSVTGIRTSCGQMIRAERVVLTGGMWTREFGARHGVNLPLQACEHYYLITEDMGLSSDLPILEDPNTYAYYREEGGGMMIGLFEPGDAAAWNLDHIPNSFEFGEIDPDWERMTPHLERAFSRVPQAMEVGIRKFFCGPESFTPDIEPLLGETPELKNLWVAAGLNSEGILKGPGIGKTMADWILDGDPGIAVGHLHVNRFNREQNTRHFRADRTKELMGKMFGNKYPTQGMQTARNVKQSVLYPQLREQGAYFTYDAGWEVALYYADSPEAAAETSHSWYRPDWWRHVEAECRAARETAILMDMSDMVKFRVQGPDASKFLQRLSTNNIDLGLNRIVYTQWLNPNGGIEADLTVTRTGEEEFMVMTAPATAGHVEMWMRRHIAADEFVIINDITSGYVQLNLHGPKAREILQQLTHQDVSDGGFPYTHARQIEIGYASVYATRITYVGELGWELIIPTTSAPQVYEQILAAAEPLGLRLAGLQALMCLRMEKGYREYGHDLDNTENPVEAGLGFFAKIDKPGGFIGRDAVAALKELGTPKRLMLQFQLESEEPILWGYETIYMNDKLVGYCSSAGQGFNLENGACMALGYVNHDEPLTADIVNDASFEIEVAGERFPARVSVGSMFDPEMARIKC